MVCPRILQICNAVFNDGDCMLLVVVVPVKYFSFSSVCDGGTTQHPLGFYLTHGRTKERGQLSVVECVV